MDLPAAFRETRIDVMHDPVRLLPLALLVSGIVGGHRACLGMPIED